jgi:hypothetical protein
MPSGEPVFLRVQPPLHARLVKVAEDFGRTRSGFVTDLLGAVLQNEALLRRDELAALAESNRHLWSIGTNLNQIARALQQRAREAGGINGDGQVAVALMKECKKDIEQHTATVVDLLTHASKARAGGRRA